MLVGVRMLADEHRLHPRGHEQRKEAANERRGVDDLEAALLELVLQLAPSIATEMPRVAIGRAVHPGVLRHEVDHTATGAQNLPRLLDHSLVILDVLEDIERRDEVERRPERQLAGV